MRLIRLSAYRHVTKSGNVTKTLHKDPPCSTARHERNWLYTYRSGNYFQQTLQRTSKAIFIFIINQLDAQNLFYNKFISYLYMFRAQCAYRPEVKIVLYSFWYHHTEISEWSKITKITKITKIYKYERIVVKFMCEFFRCDYYYVLIFIYFSNFSYFSNFRPLTCFSVMISEAV